VRHRLVALWQSFGPYHWARLRALADRFDTVGVEITSQESERGWGRGAWAAGVRVYTLRPSAGARRTRPDAFALWRILERVRPKVVLVPGYASSAALTAALWARSSRALPVLMSESTARDHTRSVVRERAKRLLVKALFPCALVSGTRAARYLETLGIPSERIALGYDVVDNDFFSAGAEALRATKDRDAYGLPENYFLFVGRLAPEKNLQGLLRAFAAYRASGGTWWLVVVGRGPLEMELRKLTTALGLDGTVLFVGARDLAGLVPCYAFAGCLVLPSVSEPWGLVVNEAMASGLPVIVSERCGCVEELVEPGRNGLVFDPRDESGLTACLSHVERMSERERQAMGARSRTIVARYTPARLAAEVERLVSGAMSR
jgi:1,2-diacylglycerol 3-alpha-glucosyltransferase